MDDKAKQAATDFELTAKEFIQIFLAVNEDDINTTPFESSWTAAQIAEHIRLSVSGTTAILNAPVQATERSPDKYAQALKDMFLDFNAKYTSAKLITPADKSYDKEKLKAGLQVAFGELIQNIETKDLNKTCLAAEIPGMGHLTGLEWVTLAIYHTQRHSHQLRGVVTHL